MPTSARTYGQFCGLARALEIVGERWGLLVVHGMVENGALKAAAGALPAPDLVIEPDGPALLDLLNGNLTAKDAVAKGRVRIEGEPAHLELFTKLFHIPPAPERAGGLA